MPMAGKEESDLPREAAPGSDNGPGADPSATFAATLASVRRHLKTPDLSKTLHGSGPSLDLSARIPSLDSQSDASPPGPALWPLSRDKADGGQEEGQKEGRKEGRKDSQEEGQEEGQKEGPKEGHDSGLPPLANTVRPDHPADVAPIGSRPLLSIASFTASISA